MITLYDIFFYIFIIDRYVWQDELSNDTISDRLWLDVFFYNKICNVSHIKYYPSITYYNIDILVRSLF